MISVRHEKDIASSLHFFRSGRKLRRLLVIRPKDQRPDEKLPGVLWIHGGGYMSGMPGMVYITRAIDLVSKGRAVVFSPEYTLSVFRPYPAALEDCYAALLYICANAQSLGIRPDQIMVGGESAGGGLAAALCMLAKDSGQVNIAYQMPLYPMLDCFDTPSSRDNHAKGWNTRKNHFAWKMYLRGLKDKKKIPCYASPSRREDYGGLPPCYTFVGDLEPFLDETVSYVENLQKAGIDAEVDIWPGFYHAYDVYHPQNEDSRKAAARFLEKFLEAREKYFAPQSADASAGASPPDGPA